MSKYGWTLWASIQDANSDLDFDFWEWGMEKYAGPSTSSTAPTSTACSRRRPRLIDATQPLSPTQPSDN